MIAHKREHRTIEILEKRLRLPLRRYRPPVRTASSAAGPSASSLPSGIEALWTSCRNQRPANVCQGAVSRVSSRPMRALTNSITAILLMATAAFAQQTHVQYEPPNGPGAGQTLLAQFAGDWDFVQTFFPAKGKPLVTKGTCKQYMIQDGKFLQSDFTFFNADGTKSTGTGISGFDSKTNKFTTVWFDSRRTAMSIRQSDGTFDGKDIVLWATPLDTEHAGRKSVARAHLEDDGRVLIHRHFLIDDQGKERMIFELRMTRK